MALDGVSTTSDGPGNTGQGAERCLHPEQFVAFGVRGRVGKHQARRGVEASPAAQTPSVRIWPVRVVSHVPDTPRRQTGQDDQRGWERRRRCGVGQTRHPRHRQLADKARHRESMQQRGTAPRDAQPVLPATTPAPMRAQRTAVTVGAVAAAAARGRARPCFSAGWWRWVWGW